MLSLRCSFVRKNPHVDAVGFHNEPLHRICGFQRLRIPRCWLWPTNICVIPWSAAKRRIEADGILAMQGFHMGSRGARLSQTRVDHFPVLDVESVLLDIQDVEIAVEAVGLAAPAPDHDGSVRARESRTPGFAHALRTAAAGDGCAGILRADDPPRRRPGSTRSRAVGKAGAAARPGPARNFARASAQYSGGASTTSISSAVWINASGTDSLNFFPRIISTSGCFSFTY